MSGGLVFAGFEGADSASDLFGVVRIVNILSDACLVYAGLLALVAPHFQMTDFLQVLAAFVDALLVLDQLVLELPLQGDSLVAGLRHSADCIHHEVKVVQIVQYCHVEERGEGTLFLVDANVDVVVVSAVVGQPVERLHLNYFCSPVSFI